MNRYPCRADRQAGRQAFGGLPDRQTFRDLAASRPGPHRYHYRCENGRNRRVGAHPQGLAACLAACHKKRLSCRQLSRQAARPPRYREPGGLPMYIRRMHGQTRCRRAAFCPCVLSALTAVTLLVGCGGQSHQTRPASSLGRSSTSSTRLPPGACTTFGRTVEAATAAAGRKWTWSLIPGGEMRTAGSDFSQFICKGFLHDPSRTVNAEASNDVSGVIGVSSGPGAAENVCPITVPLEMNAMAEQLERQVAGPVSACGDKGSSTGKNLNIGVASASSDWAAHASAFEPSEPGQGGSFLSEADLQRVTIEWLLAINFDGKTLPASSHRQAPSTSTAGSPQHLTTAQAYNLLATEPCSLIPPSLAERALNHKVNPAPERLGCSYYATATLSSLVTFFKHTSQNERFFLEEIAPAQQYKVVQESSIGEHGTLLFLPQEPGTSFAVEAFAFTDQRFVVKGTITYPAGSTDFGPKASHQNLIAFAKAVAAAIR
ncbi:MAG: hypothetical protein JWM60_855 [Solirubrobacterales bacterium]|nr:hypothetical protein [Solirubrobacterales bacterium]